MQASKHHVSSRVDRFDLGAFECRILVFASGALVSSAGSAALVAYNPRLSTALTGGAGPTWLGWLVLLLTLAGTLALQSVAQRLSLAAARLSLLIWSIGFGCVLGLLGRYAGGINLEGALLGAAAAYGALAFIALVARGAVTAWSRFAAGSSIGLLVAFVLNLAVGATYITMIVAGGGVLALTTLAVADQNHLLRLYEGKVRDPGSSERWAMISALTLLQDLLIVPLSLVRLVRRR